MNKTLGGMIGVGDAARDVDYRNSPGVGGYRGLNQMDAEISTEEAPGRAGERASRFDDSPREGTSLRASGVAKRFIESRLIPPLLHGDEQHQQWLREELRKWIPDLKRLLNEN